MTRKEGQETTKKGPQQAEPPPLPIIKQKKKQDRKNLDSIHNDQTRLSMDNIEPIHPSTIVKNTHKTRI